MRFLLGFCILFLSLLDAQVQYTPFIEQQLKIIQEMDDDNITKEMMDDLVLKQEMLYEDALTQLMANKSQYINSINTYATEIFSLQKIMKINKRAGHSYAVLRDEVQMKIYEVLKAENMMIHDILLALDAPTFKEYEKHLEKIIVQNQQKIQSIYAKDYAKYLKKSDPSSIFQKVQQNIRTFYNLKELNNNMVSYIFAHSSDMYALHKYAKYHLINIVVAFDKVEAIKQINHVLNEYNLSVIKIVFILVLIGVIYLFRTIVFVALESYILKIDFLRHYSKEILDKLHKPIGVFIIFVNVNMIIYVYNNLSSVDVVAKIFDIIYVGLITYMVYEVVNAIAAVKLGEVSSSTKEVKHELINVGLKILNFVIFIIGLLFILYVAGVNLTAVLSGLGIGGFAVAFAARDTISNFFGTLSILFSDVFSQGDWIVVGPHEGVVVEIGLRVTTIRTFDNAMIAIPNGTFATSEVKNWNKRTLGRRIKMKIGVKYDSNCQDLQNAIQDLRVMLEQHPGIATEKTTYEHKRYHRTKIVSHDDHEGVKRTLLVYLDEFADSSINILIYCFSKSVQWKEWLEVKEDVLLKIMQILEKNNLEFAFPSLSLYHENEAIKELNSPAKE